MSSRAILLVNLGSPNSTSVKDVKRYLSEFLMDERVIDLPYVKRLLLVKGIIVPFRAAKSAAKYRAIWTDKGSPLIVITNELAKKVASQSQLPVYIAMRYGNPNATDAFKRILLEHPNLDEVVLMPLYPHYAMSSYETAVKNVKDVFFNNEYPFSLRVVRPYYNNHYYISALVDSFMPYINNDNQHFLFSYHGVPERQILKTDPTQSHCLKSDNCCSTNSVAHQKCYRHQVFETTHLVCQQLGIKRENYTVSFQSRLGREPWLKPSTSNMLKELPKKGIRDLVVACPAFVSDCLETLEEIQVEGRELFLEAGGGTFTVVPCLNINEVWVNAICRIVDEVL